MISKVTGPNFSKESSLFAAQDIALSQVIRPESQLVIFPANEPLRLDGGQEIPSLAIAYQTYGALNSNKSNAILICHALTGDQHVANTHPVTGKGGWWETLVGPNKPIDTDRFFVICANILGG